jgi:LDH2 family malate/lactate/ureidoglycolate dehydrogenase
VNDLKSSSRLPGVNQIRVPGDGAAKLMSERLQRGIPISIELQESLNNCAKECGIAVIDL